MSFGNPSEFFLSFFSEFSQGCPLKICQDFFFIKLFYRNASSTLLLEFLEKFLMIFSPEVLQRYLEYFFYNSTTDHFKHCFKEFRPGISPEKYQEFLLEISMSISLVSIKLVNPPETRKLSSDPCINLSRDFFKHFPTTIILNICKNNCWIHYYYYLFTIFYPKVGIRVGPIAAEWFLWILQKFVLFFF